MPQKSVTGHITRCQVCGQEPLELVLDLGHQPPCHAHLTSQQLNEPETSYPLRLVRCSGCGLLQLDYIVPPEVAFPREYPYLTGMTNMLVRNFRELTAALAEKYALTPQDLAVDIGSNDGTLLQGFREKGIKVLGIEPTDIAKIAEKNGIPTLQKFFGEEAGRDAAAQYGKAKMITATNVFAHVADISSFMAGVSELLADDGVFVSESQYLADIVEKLEYDTIYHEHLRFYALKPLIKLFSLAGFTLTDAERITAAGGSIRVYAMKGEHPAQARVAEIIAEEERIGLYEKPTWEDFARRAKKAKHDLLTLLLECKKTNGRIVGIGAPARSNTLLGFSRIDHDILDYAGERKGSPKIGLFTPGTHIPIVDEEAMLREQPEYALILSWHIGEELAKKIRELGYQGTFIMPLPNPRILTDI